ncbi:MAG: phage portal protein [Rickettsiales bacterium]|nr:phage portal protein [Pseudomonadota bacterium]MDA0966873.1 phage portal protein [Pseudomonadota bacterium]MDG4543548.1 phage portal protein [Rickettsiales bacterium]MDG4545696.1 phage portal protein [Rickettsiales bacterium]MDG4547531.1 phage portal protein [Rickettsiales bacterium]
MRFWFSKSKRSNSKSLGHPRDPALVKWLFAGMPNSSAGISVTADSAMTLTAVSNCVRVIAEDIATIPLILYERLVNEGKERAVNHPIYDLLHNKPNRWQTSSDFRRMMLGHYLLRGNCYAEKIYLNSGKLSELIPLHPDRVFPFKAPDGHIAYKYTPINGKSRILLQHEMHHFADISNDGIKGQSRIEQASEALGFSLATNQYGSKIFANGAVPGFLLKHPAKLSEEAATRLIKSWEKRHKGSENANRPAVLEEGMDYKEVGISPDDAQFLDSKKFSRSEICGMFRVPPHKIGDLERSTFKNIESQAIEYVVDALRPIAVSWEQAYARDLLSENDRQKYFIEHLLDGLLRGDIKSRYEAYAIGREKGWLSANDIRRKENMNPIGESGDIYLVPLNMIPADKVGNFYDSDDTPPSKDERSFENRKAIFREKRSVEEISRTKAAFKPIFNDSASRIVRFEIKALQRAVNKYLTKGSDIEFKSRLNEFYKNFDVDIEKNMLPSLTTFAASIYAIAADEIGLASKTISPEITRFINKYSSNMAKRYILSSQEQIGSIINSNPDNLVQSLNGRFDEWREKRPSKIALREVVQGSSAIQKETYKKNGIRQLKWKTIGDNCPLCSSLDGKVVSIESNFVQKGDEINIDGSAPLKIKRSIGHPQLHEGCDCQIVAA